MGRRPARPTPEPSPGSGGPEAHLPARWRVLVFAGGAVGAWLRVAVDDLAAPGAGRWPWETLAVNLAGAFLLGAVVVLATRPRWAGGPFLALVGVGLLGALTTFSALALEAWELHEAGRTGVGAGYVSVSLAAGMVAAVAGARLAGAGASFRRDVARTS